MAEIKEHDSSDKNWINEISMDDFEDNIEDYPELPE
jgi:hypothetical protein